MDQRTTPRRHKCKHRGNYWLGFAFVLIGSLLLLRQMGVDLPFWMFKWYTIVFAVGLLIGLQNGFRDKGSLIVMTVGAVFFLNDVYADIPITDYLIPAGVIAVGLLILFKTRPGRPHRGIDGDNPSITPMESFPETAPAPSGPSTVQASGNDNFHTGDSVGNVGTSDNTSTSTNNYEQAADTHRIQSNSKTYKPKSPFEVVTVFGSTKRMVVDKSFNGGEIVAVFGGSEINFSQADIHGTVELEVVAIFGGSKLIIPSNWNVRSEAVAIFGGVEEKRDPHVVRDLNKTLVLKGSTIFGGLEITSYA